VCSKQPSTIGSLTSGFDRQKVRPKIEAGKKNHLIKQHLRVDYVIVPNATLLSGSKTRMHWPEVALEKQHTVDHGKKQEPEGRGRQI
jgi:hypothetical protein